MKKEKKNPTMHCAAQDKCCFVGQKEHRQKSRTKENDIFPENFIPFIFSRKRKWPYPAQGNKTT